MKHTLSRSSLLHLIVVFLVILLVQTGIFAFFESRMYYQRRESKLYLAANQAELIEGSMNNVLSRVYTLRALVRAANGSIDFFNEEIDEIYTETVEEASCYVKNFILAPGGIVQRIYPSEGNEALLGMNYLDASINGNAAAIEAVKENRLLLTEPFELKQGGTGIAGRLPVYLDSNGEKKFWGMAAVTLDMEYLIKQFNLDYLSESGTDYCLKYAAVDGTDHIFARSEDLPEDPIVYDINTQNLLWKLEVAPHKGWIPMQELVIGISAIMLLSFMILRILKSRAQIQTMNALLEQIAIKDNLTGCYSRHYVNVMLMNAGTSDWKDGAACYSLAVIDVDSFKSINDTYGHETGDKALAAIAGTLQKLCDELRGDCVIRYGGDEFIMLMNNVDSELFESRLKSAVENVRKIRIPKAPDLRLTVSIGGIHAQSRLSYNELFSAADKQAYMSKENGKDQYQLLEM